MAFDTHINIAAPIRRPEGRQIVEVRWPTDEEWIERSKGWALKVTQLGRGQSEQEVDSMAADHKLYQKIRQPESPDLTPFEAYVIVAELLKCVVKDAPLELDQSTVHMTVAGDFEVKHILRIPTTEEVVKFQRAGTRFIDMPHNRQQMRTNIMASIELYDKCIKGTEGYANGIPLVHKDVAIRAVINACEREAQSPADENF